MPPYHLFVGDTSLYASLLYYPGYASLLPCVRGVLHSLGERGTMRRIEVPVLPWVGGMLRREVPSLPRVYLRVYNGG